MNLFVGVDQTGAVDRKGNPKPLPLAYIKDEELHLASLPSFTKEALDRILPPGWQTEQTGLFVDAVFGLPAELNAPPLRELFAIAARNEGYGLRAAEDFFASLHTGNATRLCERLAKANSVFRARPYQKNVQCGTYRIWKELGLHGSEWLHLRYFEKEKATRPILFEAYPSLMWKRLLQLQTRDRTKLADRLPKHIKIKDLQRLEANADFADAALLALGGYTLRPKVKRSTDKRLAKEGWIFGLTEPSE